MCVCVCVCVCMNHCVVHLKLTPCKSTIPQLNFLIFKKENAVISIAHDFILNVEFLFQVPYSIIHGLKDTQCLKEI